MNTRRFNTLLVLWCAAVLAPGMLMQLGVFGRIDVHTSLPGSLALAWVLGYLVQFGLFLWIMNIVGKQKILWWLVASTLPWVVDWTLPVSPLFALLWFPVTIAEAGWIAMAARREESLQQHGIRATGVVLEVLKPLMNVVINNVYIKRKVRLRVERKDGQPAYEGILNGLFMLGQIPSPGDRIPLLVDPAQPQRFEYDKKADTSQSEHVRAAAAPPAASRASIADELEKLTDLRDRGALTQSEFDAAKKRLLRP